MGKIKKILENELIGGTQSTDVYPVTSTKAVYDENNERLDNIINKLDNIINKIEPGIIYDVSANNDGAVFESLQALLSSSSLSTLIPTSVRHGGMSIRFIQGSVPNSDNKYVQHRFMLSTFTAAQFANAANWQGVDAEPALGSKNLVESGGVFEKSLKPRARKTVELTIAQQDKYIDSSGTVKSASNYNISASVSLNAGEVIEFIGYAGSTAYLCQYNNGVYTPIYFGTIPRYTKVLYEAPTNMQVVICCADFPSSCTVYTESVSMEEVVAIVSNRLQPVCEYKGTGTIVTDITAVVGKTYIVYAFDDTTISNTGVEVYCVNHYNDNDKLVITEPNKIYEFTPAWNLNIRAYNGEDKVHILIVDKDSSLKNIIECLIPIYNDMAADSFLSKLNASTWNVGYWNNGVTPYGVPDADVSTYTPRVRALLTKICADIMVATEWVEKFDRSQTIDAYNLLLKQFYPYKYSRGNNKPAIFCKYPIVGSEGTYITAGGTYSKGVITLCGIKVVICGIHLPSAENDRATRIQMMSDLVTEYADTPYVIVAGDTNIYNTDELQPFVDAGWTLGNCGYFGNIDTWYTGTYPIDNVITKGFGIDNFEKVEDDTRAGVSDHYPVISEISTYIDNSAD